MFYDDDFKEKVIMDIKKGFRVYIIFLKCFFYFLFIDFRLFFWKLIFLQVDLLFDIFYKKDRKK